MKTFIGFILLAFQFVGGRYFLIETKEGHEGSESKLTRRNMKINLKRSDYADYKSACEYKPAVHGPSWKLTPKQKKWTFIRGKCRTFIWGGKKSSLNMFHNKKECH